ncbi:hypothetical protein N8456_06015 [Porticoccaceae bacterium]|nr:hypothetical protein [Porticoccaceae bacterium]
MFSSLLQSDVRHPFSATEIDLAAVQNETSLNESSEHWTSFNNEHRLMSDILEHRTEQFGTVIGGNVVPITEAHSLRSSFEDSFLVSLLGGYEISEIRLVNSYVGRNPDLLNFLQVINSRLLASESIDKVTLELYKDVEEGWEKLHVQADSNINSIDLIIQLEKAFFIELFVENAQTFSDRIIFSVV